MDMSTEEQIHHVEIDIEQAKKSIERMEALDRLQRSPDFELIFNQGYFIDEAARLVWLKADPNMYGEREARQIAGMIDAIGYVRQYLATIYGLGRQAQQALPRHQQTREELYMGDELDAAEGMN